MILPKALRGLALVLIHSLVPLSASPALAQAEAISPEGCVGIDSDAERLACYDRAVGRDRRPGGIEEAPPATSAGLRSRDSAADAAVRDLRRTAAAGRADGAAGRRRRSRRGGPAGRELAPRQPLGAHPQRQARHVRDARLQAGLSPAGLLHRLAQSVPVEPGARALGDRVREAGRGGGEVPDQLQDQDRPGGLRPPGRPLVRLHAVVPLAGLQQ